MTVTLAIFYLLLWQLLIRRLPEQQQNLLAALHLAAAVVFFTIAVPLKTHGHWITIGWLIEGAALLWAARRLRLWLLRLLATGSLLLGIGSLLITSFDSQGPVFFNPRFATYLTAIAVFASVAHISAKAQQGGREPRLRAERPGWTDIAAASLLAMICLLLVAGAQEIHTYWWAGHPFLYSGPEFIVRRMHAQFTYSAWAMIFGAVLLTVGFLHRSAFLRWQALMLVSLTIAKVFLYDIGNLSQGYRVLSFLGLGALLLTVSYVYQRDLLHLKNQKDPHEHTK